jgi:uncharacterized membrane protein YdjX (TVP38/TMEM64 family)
MLFYKNDVVAWIHEDQSPNLGFLLVIACLFAFFPIIPYGIVTALLGAKYGVIVGGLISVTASTTVAVVMFILFRYLFPDAAHRHLAKFNRLQYVIKMYEKHPLLAVIILRLIPIIPAQVVNIYAAISRIPLISYIVATVLGKTPVMLLWIFIGHQLV